MRTLFFFLILTTSLILNAQITKGNWMIGGDIAFSYSKSKPDSTVDSYAFTLNASPNAGYFFWNKFALGANAHYVMNRFRSDTGDSHYDSFLAAPFARYYFLDADKMVNPFLESSYRFNLIKGNNSKEFSAKAGTAIFLNSSVALEISLNYLNLTTNDSYIGSHSFLLGFGVQVHLEKL